MFTTIMIALDGSHTAEQSILAASEIARRSGAGIHLVHVLDVFSRPDYTRHMPAYEYWNGGALNAAQKYLDNTADRLLSEHPIRVTRTMRLGSIVPELLEEADNVSADMIVMTTHGVGGEGTGWIGSVADRMVRLSSRPVLLLPLQKAHTVPFTHVLVALDGSDESEAILSPAARLATVSGARITLLTVARPHFAPVPALSGFQVPFSDDAPTMSFRPDSNDTEYLEQASESIARYELDVDSQVIVTHSSPAAAILRFAELSSVDCIALATRGRGRVARQLLGSAADKIVRSAGCAVLIISPE